MEAVIEFYMDSAAFKKDPRAEFAWILRQLTLNLGERHLYDSDGNRVGLFYVSDAIADSPAQRDHSSHAALPSKDISGTNTYEAVLESDIGWARRTITAETPERALEIAREIGSANPENLNMDYHQDWECPINEIEIKEQNHYECLALWRDDNRRLFLAARELLEAALMCELVLSGLELAHRQGFVALALSKTREAIAKTMEGYAL